MTIRSLVREISEFSITVGLHQESALTSYIFDLVMDALTRDIQDEVTWCMLFAEYIVLFDENKQGLTTKLEIWKEALELKGF